ncbi:MAG: hypothetical protein LAT82_01210 [Nanoarchaeota archaeon]|nr:hypothetical protein [Nanoarchaeota archaeon]
MNNYYKILSFVCIFLFSLNLVFSSFTVYNSNFEENDFFSFQDLTFYLGSNQNTSFEFTYEIFLNDNSSSTHTQIFNASLCTITQINEEYCFQGTLLDYIHTSNTSFISAITFKITQLTTSSNIISNKTIYLDFIPPTIDIEYSINSQNQELTIEVEVRDNLHSTISNELYVEVEENSSIIRKIFNTSFQTNSTQISFNTTINISSALKHSIVVESRDRAGNLQKRTRSFELQDIFPPKLANVTITDTFSNQIKLIFDIEDESNISSWTVKLGSREYREDFTTSSNQITSGNFEIVLSQIPQNEFLIILEDEFSNSKMYNLTSQIQNIQIRTIPSIISNILRIDAQNAQECSVRGFNSNRVNEFVRTSSSSSIFELELSRDNNINIEEKEYNLEIECSNELMIQQIRHFLIVDTTPPAIEIFNVKTNSQGTVDIEFEVDNTTSRVEIFESGRIISRDNSFNSNTNLNSNTNFQGYFTDTQVQYPQEYRYRLQVYDEVGNVNISEEIRVIPQKVSVDLQVEKQEFEEFVRVTIRTEENIKGKISHDLRIQRDIQSNESISYLKIFEKPTGIVVTKEDENSVEFENLQERQFTFTILKGEDNFNVYVEIEDGVGNKNSQDLIIEALSSSTQLQQTQNGVLQQVNNNEREHLNATSNAEIDDKSIKKNIFIGSSNLFEVLKWLIICFLIVIVVFVIIRICPIMYSNIKDLVDKEKAYRELKQKEITRKKKSSQKMFHFSFGHSRNVSFDKEIYKRLEDKKIQDTKRRIEEEEKKRKLRNQQFNQRSEYDRAKFNDLNIRPQDIDFSKKPKVDSIQKINVEKEKKSYSNEDLFSNKSKVLPEKSSFISRLFSSRSPNREVNFKREELFNNKNIQNENVGNLNSNLDETVGEKSNDLLNTQNKISPKVDLGLDAYLQKRSKSKKWFLLQKQVDEEVRRRF